MVKKPPERERRGRTLRDGGDEGGADEDIWLGDEGGRMSAALRVLIERIEHLLHKQGTVIPADAFLLGAERLALTNALQNGLLESVAAIHWQRFYRFSPRLSPCGLDGLVAATALALRGAVAGGVSTAVAESLERGGEPGPYSVLFRRLTRPTGGHVIFRSQLLQLAEGEFLTGPLEMTSLLARHTPAAIRAMLQGRLIKGRPDLDSNARQTLVVHVTRHLGRLLPEEAAVSYTRRLLRLAYYRLHHPSVARAVLHRLRIVDFNAARAADTGRARPSG